MRKIPVFIVSIWLIIYGVSGSVNATDVGGIIDTNTTWDVAESPYYLISKVQIDEGVTVIIEPGVVINGNNFGIEVFGSLNSVGNSISRITFSNTEICFETKSGWIIPPSIIFQYCDFDLCKLLTNTICIGSLVLTDCSIRDCKSTFYCSAKETTIERNKFIASDPSQTYVVDIDYLYASGLCSIQKNLFVNVYSKVIGLNLLNNAFYGEEGILIGMREVSNSTIELNSFYSTNISINCGPHSDCPLENNYWNTTDASVIDNIIYDKNDDLSIPYYVDYTPFLLCPDPDTPSIDINQTPTAEAGPDQIVFDTITLDGSFTSDPDGDSLTYEWFIQRMFDSTNDQTATGQIVTLTGFATGFYNVTLTVTDFSGASDTDTMQFSATGLMGDFDFDGDVDGDDLSKFSENFGQ